MMILYFVIGFIGAFSVAQAWWYSNWLHRPRVGRVYMCVAVACLLSVISITVKLSTTGIIHCAESKNKEQR